MTAQFSPAAERIDGRSSFAGFAPPTSNTTYTPNQFFDVCLPHSSRGAVRLVAFVIRKTLGWCDRHGQPQAEQHAIPFTVFEREAGISRDMIKAAVEEAIAGHFIRQVELGAPNRAGHQAITASYELRWDEGSEYVKDPRRFRGFFAGEGNRTYIPNQFFDVIVPHQTLAVIKVVGSIIRFSIGFQNKFGHRRQVIALSYQDIQNYSRIRNRSTLGDAIQLALARNYIQRVEEGYFDKNAGRLSRAAIYALKWLGPAVSGLDGQKNGPGKTELSERSENQTGNGQKNGPDRRSEKRTDIQIKQSNKTLKQQPDLAVAFERLRAQGFNQKAAWAIASKYPGERILRQTEWLPLRRIKSNRLGLLRASIEQDWAPPTTSKLGAPNRAERASGSSFAEALQQMEQRLLKSANHQSQ